MLNKNILEKTLIIVPTYNEGKVLKKTLSDLQHVFPNILLIDDGSNDSSVSNCTLNKLYKIRHFINLGQGKSIETGCSVMRNESVGAGVINHKLEINFWSCQTGDGVMGKNYTQRVANLCNADVNAASGLIGHE